MISRVYQMLGIATKAGKTRSGSYLAEDAVRSRKARLVLIAEDAEYQKASGRQMPVLSGAGSILRNQGGSWEIDGTGNPFLRCGDGRRTRRQDSDAGRDAAGRKR